MAEHVDGVEVKIGADEPKADLVKVQPRAATMARSFAGLMPTTIGEAFQLAQYLAASDAVPKNLRKPESMLTVILAGLELGLSPIRAVQSITNIHGKLGMGADLQLGLVKQSGVLAIYDESYEVKGQTDANLARRIGLVVKDPDAAGLVFEKIQAAIQAMPDGKPYAWAMAQRKGEHLQVRTFTWLDAEKAFTYEDDPANPNAAKVRKKLSEKFNYQSWPGDMYPKRARGRLLNVTAGDVLAGLPSTESIEGGQVVDAEVIASAVEPSDGVADLLARMRGENAEAVTGIENGFKALAFGQARQLQLLREHQDDPAALWQWLRDEKAKRDGHRDGKGPAVPKPAGKKKAQANHPVAKPAAEPKPEPNPADQVPDAEVVTEPPKPAAPAQAEAPKPAAGGMASLANLAAQFRKTPSGSL